jgi:hypothetical protein
MSCLERELESIGRNESSRDKVVKNFKVLFPFPSTIILIHTFIFWGV